ncbi:unnamed protein product [Cuscuta epithymum]|uniref:Uncharacterized protein n=1 Tax=Cuscuta epithymum TaxID=186058 RepID=A0AAV0CR48_9ASTE|nr:unnamed protein product [Cuscuta epithymum]
MKGFHWKCADDDTIRKPKTVVCLSYFTIAFFVIGCALLAMGIPTSGKSAGKSCPSVPTTDPTVAYAPSFQEPHSTKVCTALAAPIVGGIVVLFHAVSGALYYVYAADSAS